MGSISIQTSKSACQNRDLQIHKKKENFLTQNPLLFWKTRKHD